MKKAKKLEKRIRVMEEKIDGLDAMLESSTTDFYKTKARLDAYTEKCRREREGK